MRQLANLLTITLNLKLFCFLRFFIFKDNKQLFFLWNHIENMTIKWCSCFIKKSKVFSIYSKVHVHHLENKSISLLNNFLKYQDLDLFRKVFSKVIVQLFFILLDLNAEFDSEKILSNNFDVETFALPSHYVLKPISDPKSPSISDRYLTYLILTN